MKESTTPDPKAQKVLEPLHESVLDPQESLLSWSDILHLAKEEKDRDSLKKDGDKN